MILVDNEWEFKKVTSNLRILFDETTNRTDAVLAKIQHRSSTKPRPAMPDLCGNGYKTESLPFAMGHVIALELGGSNHKLNIVPQFENWQGKPNGDWRAMEMELSRPAYAGAAMLVELTYGRVGAVETHDAAKAAFDADRLRDWTDPRIPDAFHVRVWPAGTDWDKNLTTEAQFRRAIAAFSAAPMYERRFQLGTGIPQPDRQMEAVQTGLTIAKRMFSRQNDITDEREFLLLASTIPAVQDALKRTRGITPFDAAGTTVFELVRAYQKDLTQPQFWKAYALHSETLKGRIVAKDSVGISPASKRGRDDKADDNATAQSATKKRRLEPGT